MTQINFVIGTNEPPRNVTLSPHSLNWSGGRLLLPISNARHFWGHVHITSAQRGGREVPQKADGGRKP